MPLQFKVPGAAGSGTRHEAGSLKATTRKADWTCPQGHPNKGHWTRCLTLGCNVKRGSA